MRHKKSHRKFGRDSAHRNAMLRNLATSLLKHGRITTTLAKAKDLRGVVEPMVTKAKVDNVHNRRWAYNYIYEKPVVHRLFTEIAPRYANRPGGYTRVIKLGNRANDAAPMAIIELVDSPLVAKKMEAKAQAADAE